MLQIRIKDEKTNPDRDLHRREKLGPNPDPHLPDSDPRQCTLMQVAGDFDPHFFTHGTLRNVLAIVIKT